MSNTLYVLAHGWSTALNVVLGHRQRKPFPRAFPEVGKSAQQNLLGSLLKILCKSELYSQDSDSAQVDWGLDCSVFKNLRRRF